MKDYQLIATFTYPTELVVVRSLLESNNIDCFVRDELTVQVHNFYSNAIGGIRLEVPADQYERAHQLLLDNGFDNHLISSSGVSPGGGHESQSSTNKVINYGVGIVVIAASILIAVIIVLRIME
ncbi:MAG: DUF2007 domain-containing protein [Bacteroidota bacterium]